MSDQSILRHQIVHSVLLAEMHDQREIWNCLTQLGCASPPNTAVVVRYRVPDNRTFRLGEGQKFTLRAQISREIQRQFPNAIDVWHEADEYMILLEHSNTWPERPVVDFVLGLIDGFSLPFSVQVYAGVDGPVENFMMLPAALKSARQAAIQAMDTGRLVLSADDMEVGLTAGHRESSEWEAGYFKDEPSGQATSENPSEIVTRAIHFIHENLHHPLLLTDIASHCAVSHFYLSHLFRRETGTTVTAYVKQARIERAMSLLHDGRVSIADVAYQVGFQDPNYFSKAFRSQVGMSPSEYRRKPDAALQSRKITPFFRKEL